MKKIGDLIAATYAPMKEDGSLNLSIIPEYALFLKKNGVKGAFVNGSTGDFVSLSIEERMALIEAWSNERSEDFAVINHVGDSSLDLSQELVKHSAPYVDAISALTPYYFRVPDLNSLVKYCQTVASAAPDLPFYYYHIPVLSRADFKMSEFIPMAIKEIPNFKGIKFTKNDLIDFKQSIDVSEEKCDLLFGVDELFVNGLIFGAQGWVGSTYNHLAPLYQAIRSAVVRGDLQTAVDLQAKSMKFVDILAARGGFNGAGKSFMQLLGLDCGPSRYPHKTLDRAELEEIRSQLEQEGIMQYTSQQ